MQRRFNKKILLQKEGCEIIESIVISALFLTGTPILFDYFKKVPSWIYILVILCFVFFVLYLLSKIVESYNNKIHLSQIHHKHTHKLRDIYVKSINALRNKSFSSTIVEDTCETICQEIGNVFKEIKKNDEIGVAIRLAKKENNGIYYETKGRFGLDSGRKDTSKAILRTTGLPGFLNKNNESGCLIYYNIFEAAKVNTFELTPNEQNAHKSEITSLMALLLNCGFSKPQKEMIGILYITSPQESFFTVHDVDFARNLADFAAIIITQVLLEFRIYQSNLKKQPTFPGKQK